MSESIIPRFIGVVRAYVGIEKSDGDEKERQRRQGKILGRLTSARLSLASVKVIVFSGYINLIWRMAKHFGNQAVVVTGEVLAAQRQLRVAQIRFPPC